MIIHAKKLFIEATHSRREVSPHADAARDAPNCQQGDSIAVWSSTPSSIGSPSMTKQEFRFRSTACAISGNRLDQS
jgi:hypothetical protein